MKGLYAIIDPEHCGGRDPSWVAAEVLRGGCAALQLRAKALPDRARLELARKIASQCRDRGVTFWMNDRVDLGLLAGASGVHLGQDDLPLADARRLLAVWRAAGDRPRPATLHERAPKRPNPRLCRPAAARARSPKFAARARWRAREPMPVLRLGLSTHSLREARAAARLGADVIGFGPIFATRSKPNPAPCVGLAGLREVCAEIACPVIAIGGIELVHARELARAGASYAAAIGAVCAAPDPQAAARALHEALLAG